MGSMGVSRMRAALPEGVEYYKHKDFNEVIKAEIIAMSESSIKRFLEGPRKALDRKPNSGTNRGGALKSLLPRFQSETSKALQRKLVIVRLIVSHTVAQVSQGAVS